MNDVRRCDEHGLHDRERCPVCDASGAVVCTADRRRRLSKFVSGALRHFPEDAGLELDDRGWTDLDAVVDAVTDRYDWATRETLLGVVATDPKGRFELDGVRARGPGTDTDGPGSEPSDGRVRAAYGHSVGVDLEPAADPVPDVLYHGTSPASLDAIERDGLQPMSRQLVHLSETVAAAQSVGARHADDPVVLRVDAADMQADGHRVTKRGVDVYTTERVPPAYLDGPLEGPLDEPPDDRSTATNDE